MSISCKDFEKIKLPFEYFLKYCAMPAGSEQKKAVEEFIKEELIKLNNIWLIIKIAYTYSKNGG